MAAANTNKTLEDIFSCSLCCQQYDICVNIPKNLCAHTFCVLCLDKVITEAYDNDLTPKCPKCKAEFSTPNGGASKLPTNLSVHDMIQLNLHQQISPEDRADVTPERGDGNLKCETHRTSYVVMVCLKCEVGLCTKCIKTLTKSGHSKHVLEDIDTYLSNYKDILDELAKRSNHLPERYDNSKTTAAKSLSDVKQERDKTIDELAELAIQKVKKWQKSQKSVVMNRVCNRSYLDKLRSMVNSSDPDVNDKDVTSAMSKVDALRDCKPQKLPCVSAAKSAMESLEVVEERCQVLRDKKYCKPPIFPIYVTNQG